MVRDMDGRLDRIPWISVMLAALTICGLLAMHGFEAALVHPGHAGPSGHAAGASVSPIEQHLQHGICSLDIRHPEPELQQPMVCPSEPVVGQIAAPPESAHHLLWSLANRAVLTAHSILRL